MHTHEDYKIGFKKKKKKPVSSSFIVGFNAFIVSGPIDGMAYLSTLSGSDKREGLANIEAKGHIK